MLFILPDRTMKTLYVYFIFSCLLHILPISSFLSYMPWT